MYFFSPLVGPTTWKWVSEELCSEVDAVVVPTVAALSAGWRAVASEFADQVPDTPGVVLVAHGGAGLLLPSIVDRARAIDPRNLCSPIPLVT
jgi:threonine dehydratase